VQVATKSPDGRSEEECLATFKQLYPAERDELERRGGGFGVQCLLQQLVKLQASMVQQLDIPALIYKASLQDTSQQLLRQQLGNGCACKTSACTGLTGHPTCC
jgi:hypothetical protein